MSFSMFVENNDIMYLPLLLIGMIPLFSMYSVESYGASNEGFSNIALLKKFLDINQAQDLTFDAPLGCLNTLSLIHPPPE